MIGPPKILLPFGGLLLGMNAPAPVWLLTAYPVVSICIGTLAIVVGIAMLNGANDDR